MLFIPGKRKVPFWEGLVLFVLIFGEVRAETPTEIDSLFKEGKKFWAYDPSMALSKGRDIIKISKAAGYEKGEADGIYLVAMSQWYLEDYSESLKNIAEAHLKYQLLGDQLGVAACYNSFGMIYHQVGDDGESLEYFFKALKISDDLGYIDGSGRTLQNIGVVYRDQGDLDLSLSYILRSIPYFKQMDFNIISGNEYANVGLTFQLMGKYDSALKYYGIAYQSFSDNKNDISLIKYYEKVGELYLSMDMDPLAEENFKQGLALSRSLELNEGILGNGKGLIRTWDRSGRADLSDSLIKELDPIAVQLQNPRTRMNWYMDLSTHYQHTDQQEKSLELYKMSTSLKDSILGADQKTLMSQLRAINDLESIQQENEILKKNLDITKKMNLGVALALIIFLGLLIMISRFYNLKQRANLRLSDLNQQLRNQRRETETKAQELQEANNTISSINSELEKIIEQRTAELKKKNKKILDFAFFNSHQVRGSLARIMGLLEVFNESSGKKETKSVSNLLRSQAGELDDLIRDINKILAEEGYSEGNPT